MNDRCMICKATFPNGVLKENVCPTCLKEHGGPVDVEELLRKSNPELFPAPEYLLKTEADNYVTKEEAKKMVSDAVKMAVARLSKGDN